MERPQQDRNMKPTSFQSNISKGLIEFTLIVAGVTIALWLENVAEDYKEAQIEQGYLLSFKDDVTKDIKRLDYLIKNNQVILSNVEKVLTETYVRTAKIRKSS